MCQNIKNGKSLINEIAVFSDSIYIISNGMALKSDYDLKFQLQQFYVIDFVVDQQIRYMQRYMDKQIKNEILLKQYFYLRSGEVVSKLNLYKAGNDTKYTISRYDFNTREWKYGNILLLKREWTPYLNFLVSIDFEGNLYGSMRLNQSTYNLICHIGDINQALKYVLLQQIILLYCVLYPFVLSTNIYFYN